MMMMSVNLLSLLRIISRLRSEKASQVRSKLLLLNIQFICQTLFIVYDHRGSDRDEEQWSGAREFYQTPHHSLLLMPSVGFAKSPI